MPIINPIVIDTDNSAGISVKNVTQNTSAKEFFSPRFTGTGKKMGLLNENTDTLPDLKKTQAAWHKKARTKLTHAVISFGSSMLVDDASKFITKGSLEEGDGEAFFFPLDMTPYGIMERYLLQTDPNGYKSKGYLLKNSEKYKGANTWHEIWSNSQLEIRVKATPIACSIRNEMTFNAQTNRNMNNTCPFFSYSLDFSIRNKTATAEDILFRNSKRKTYITEKELLKYYCVIEHYDVAEIMSKPIGHIAGTLKTWLTNKGWASADIADEITRLEENYSEWYADYSHSKALRELASDQSAVGDEMILAFLTDAIEMAKSSNIKASTTANIISNWVKMLDSCQSYNNKHLLSNSLLEKIADIIEMNEKWLTTDKTYKIFNQSLRLLLAKRLKELHTLKTKNQLHQFKATDNAIKKKYQNDKNWSNQQKAIIISEDPLIIGAAGAGSGKSHTVIGRLSYLKEQGVDLSKVGVFSFTNIAADNIRARYKGIRSETLANMFNEIYQMNYPNQILSQSSTLSHTLQMINPNHKALSKWKDKDALQAFIKNFTYDLEQFDKQGFQRVNLQEAYRDLNECLRENLELVETLLDMAGQTTLELEPAILHIHLQQGMNKIKVPNKYRDLEFIITDESQDISTFEYIILLELAIHHKAQLLIVGDGAQTLYEFRNSDPRYINALEGSGVFQSQKLDVNYRSNQEILDFANQFLEVIEANDIAQIQLSADKFTTPTIQSMKDAITIRNMPTEGKRADKYNEALENYLLDDKITQEWILDRVRRGEQIAFLAWTNAEIEILKKSIEKILKKNGFPVAQKDKSGKWNKGIRCASITKQKQNTYTLMSQLLISAGPELHKIPTDSTNNAELKKLFKKYINGKNNPHGSKKRQNTEYAINNAIDRITREYDPFSGTYGGYLSDYKAVLFDVQTGKLTKDQYVAYFKKKLIEDEIAANSVKNYLKGVETTMEEIKSNDPATKIDIVFSTIHSAKGLEFDHVVVCHNNNKRSAHTQEALRLFFVGLSRAKNSELIINGQYSDPYGRHYTSSGRSGMLQDPMNTAYSRCITNIKNGVRPVSGKLEKDITEFNILEDE